MKKYEGGCHCGAVRFEADVDLANTMTCNCSICNKKGHILTFTGEEQFTLKKGEGQLQGYTFNKKKIHHMFCKTCGVGAFGKGVGPDGKKMYAINARCLDNVDITQLHPKAVDGASF